MKNEEKEEQKQTNEILKEKEKGSLMPKLIDFLNWTKGQNHYFNGLLESFVVKSDPLKRELVNAVVKMLELVELKILEIIFDGGNDNG